MKLRPTMSAGTLRKGLAVVAGLAATFAIAVALHASGAGADIPRNVQHIPCPHPAALPAPPTWT
ncbi:hypothetical protein GPX89_20415 [Nocardia sp. ET3-3]|uniref:Uncharacterized protein n=1 Tax=Nocardia terrae TaxID=2675851 RepID=A0A7K1UZK5_9NOCA|nr:hypothetical protein [Nocardia terrae]MVU79599.1 hypothetical protein [Nocardia terrae]